MAAPSVKPGARRRGRRGARRRSWPWVRAACRTRGLAREPGRRPSGRGACLAVGVEARDVPARSGAVQETLERKASIVPRRLCLSRLESLSIFSRRRRKRRST